MGRFRTGMSSPEGMGAAQVLEARVFGVNLVNWTVDVRSSFDRHTFYDIRVSSPYSHFSNGEGFFAMPEIGAKCLVCIPSDTSPPCVVGFIMPYKKVDLATPDAPQGTTSQSEAGKKSTGASFAGNRSRAKGGDLGMRGRDGNFVILHRGGVLQIGSNELSQRIFLPLNNVVMDVSENYSHHNSGGTVFWGLQPTSTGGKTPSEYFQTYRVFANDKFADVRIKVGHVVDPVQGKVDTYAKLKQVIYEVTIAPQGFDVASGSIQDAKLLQLRFAFDAEGNALLGGEGSLSIFFKKDVFIRSASIVDLQAKSINVQASDGAVIDGGSYTQIRGKIVKIGPGNKPVAYQGSIVSVQFPFTPVVASAVPLILKGSVDIGDPEVLV